MGVTKQVLGLHQGITEVSILEERAGHLEVIEEAAKGKAARLEGIIADMTESSALGPAVILGAAAQIGKVPGSLSLVGILYRDVGIILSPLGENKVLALSTDPQTLGEAIRIVNDALPGLVKKALAPSEDSNLVNSAVEAGAIARDYLASSSNFSHVFVSEIKNNAGRETWEVRGTHRPSLLTQAKPFELEIRAEDGAIVTFRSSASSSIFFGLWLGALLASLGVVMWMLYSLWTR